ncbi:hypothetical protein GCM10007978_27010 [Shewanella hanedai]|nr:hypothetical protein GCM10007978_27010 [Shewanella hanedai]
MAEILIKYYTNQYKDLIAQREFSGSEARQRVKSIVIPTVKLVNTVSEPLKLSCKECFWLPTSALNELIRE